MTNTSGSANAIDVVPANAVNIPKPEATSFKRMFQQLVAGGGAGL